MSLASEAGKGLAAVGRWALDEITAACNRSAAEHAARAAALSVPPDPRLSWAASMAESWRTAQVPIPPALVMQTAQGLVWPPIVGWRTGRPGQVILRFRVWQGQTTQQLVAAQAQIESAIGYPISRWDPVPGDVYGADATVGWAVSLDSITPTQDMTALYPADPVTWAVYLGWSTSGPVTVRPRNKAGLLLSGVPGSGKSVALLRLLVEWRMAGAAVGVIDMKGGADYRVLVRAGCHVVGDDMDAALALLEDAQRGYEQRVQYMAGHGLSNWWDVPPSSRPPLLVVAVDEVQEALETAGVDKERKEKAMKAVTLLTSLVKRGRSVGIFVVLASQKVDSTAIPTRLRDVMAIRISGEQKTREASRAALGELRDGDLRPDDPAVIPPGTPGRVVLAGQSREMVLVQVAPISDGQVEAVLGVGGAVAAGGGAA